VNWTDLLHQACDGVATLVFGAWLIAENPGLGLSHGVESQVDPDHGAECWPLRIVTAADVGDLGPPGFRRGPGLMAVFRGLDLAAKPNHPLRSWSWLADRRQHDRASFSQVFTNFFVGALPQHIRVSRRWHRLAFLPKSLRSRSFAGFSAIDGRFGPEDLGSRV